MSRAPDRHISAFLAEVAAVFPDAVGIPAVVDADAAHAAPEIAVIIHVHGDLSGVTWTFPAELARLAALQMAPGIDPDPALCETAASELANILTGRGIATLAAHGVHIEIEPPQIAAAAAPGRGGKLATSLGAVEVVFHERAGAAS